MCVCTHALARRCLDLHWGLCFVHPGESLQRTQNAHHAKDKPTSSRTQPALLCFSPGLPSSASSCEKARDKSTCSWPWSTERAWQRHGHSNPGPQTLGAPPWKRECHASSVPFPSPRPYMTPHAGQPKAEITVLTPSGRPGGCRSRPFSRAFPCSCLDSAG